MQFRFDHDADALYIALEGGEVARTVDVTDMVYVYVGAHGAVLAIEFVSADEFVPFLRHLHALEDGAEWKDTVPASVREFLLAGTACPPGSAASYQRCASWLAGSWTCDRLSPDERDDQIGHGEKRVREPGDAGSASAINNRRAR